MPDLQPSQVVGILDSFQQLGVSVSTFICSLLNTSDALHHAAARDIAGSCDIIFDGFLQNETLRNTAIESIHRLAKTIYTKEVTLLSKHEAGTHFNARHAKQADLDQFNLTDLSEKFEQLAPHACDLVKCLLDADADLAKRREQRPRNARRRHRRHAAPANQEPPAAASADDSGKRGGNAGTSTGMSARTDTAQRPLVQTTGSDSDEDMWGELGVSRDGADIDTGARSATASGGAGQLPGGDIDPVDNGSASGSDEDMWGELGVSRDGADIDSARSATASGGAGQLQGDIDVDMIPAGGCGGDGPNAVNGSDDEYWNELEPLPEGPDDLDSAEEAERRLVICRMKCVLCISIMAQSSNQRSNALQSVIGIYLHSCKAPESVVDLLARVGVSISQSAINAAVKNLARESMTGIKKLGRTLLTMYAYDNFDCEMRHLVPTVQKPHDTLIHMTSGTFIPFNHGVSLSDLDCSNELWEQSLFNPLNAGKTEKIDWEKLLNLHPEPDHPSGLSRRERWNAGQFMRDLFLHGPEYFRQFLTQLDDPEPIDPIPLVKSTQVPAMAMDINQSSVQGNIDALTALFQQAGVGDPSDTEQSGVRDVGNHVVLVHGDLSTCERVQSLRQSRGEESKAFRRFQLVIFVIGLFHLKMACVDAIWKVFILPLKGRDDDTSLMKQVAEIRPRETQKIASKPGFRRMHEVVQHVGAVSRLDCWRQELATRTPSFGSLEQWAESAPCMEEIEQIAHVLVRKYVADSRLSEERHAPSHTRDEQWENVRLRERLFLLYEELTWAMNAGDIGRVEECFLPWAYIFKGCGKHKYATQMVRFLNDVHCVYPAPLRRAIRMNILCNPTGKKHHFRAIDWWVEHNNYYIKGLRWQTIEPNKASDH
ncbi:uncharacterized protein C8Q71DRAFT_177393 [Rhodofomes roseus]|uniref:DUF6589 domain-containing protein n=1 Tax=Rhodofomes roseus TaxID=34475 RepID=A0ABQ8KAH8_9APHY|nr:uncharacterized protein C8Q71DRAFT_177393 [Rhodofomes roseus]KAH9833826.1 hypothetical protein C8Q71DRAFT_177393 [Rhodofomes roseus]